MEYDLVVCICIFTFTASIHSIFICKFHHDINRLYDKMEKVRHVNVHRHIEVVSDPVPMSL